MLGSDPVPSSELEKMSSEKLCFLLRLQGKGLLLKRRKRSSRPFFASGGRSKRRGECLMKRNDSGELLQYLLTRQFVKDAFDYLVFTLGNFAKLSRCKGVRGGASLLFPDVHFMPPHYFHLMLFPSPRFLPLSFISGPFSTSSFILLLFSGRVFSSLT